jgi:hypothetical protein
MYSSKINVDENRWQEIKSSIETFAAKEKTALDADKSAKEKMEEEKAKKNPTKSTGSKSQLNLFTY